MAESFTHLWLMAALERIYDYFEGEKKSRVCRTAQLSAPRSCEPYQKIQDYLESENPIMPNSLVLALDPESLRFKGQNNNEDSIV